MLSANEEISSGPLPARQLWNIMVTEECTKRTHYAADQSAGRLELCYLFGRKDEREHLLDWRTLLSCRCHDREQSDRADECSSRRSRRLIDGCCFQHRHKRKNSDMELGR